jgi:ABC-2 type transport system ATP-binding protein
MSIVLQNVNKTYGRHHAVKDLSLEIRAGELFAFLGPNGAGKTSTIRMICGLLKPDGGTITVCGCPVVGDALEAKARLALVPDEPCLYERLTGREFQELIGRLYRVDETTLRRRIGELAERFETGGYLDQLSGGYSHGMKQRVLLCAALLHEPEVLILDEPMVGLDPKGVRLVKDILRERTRAGGCVLMSTHTLEMAEQIADRVGIMNHGRLLKVGTPAEILLGHHEPGARLEDVFLHLTSLQPAAAPPGP